MFSSDFPHVEGGRNPIARFERSMDAAGLGAVARERFYVENFDDLLGPVLDRRGVSIGADVGAYDSRTARNVRRQTER